VSTLSRPDDETLLHHAAGRLDAGFALVLDTHLALNSTSREIFTQFEEIGGLLLDECAPAPVEPSALNVVLAALDKPAREDPRVSREAQSFTDMPSGLTLPPPLVGRRMGPWRWIAPGVRSRRIDVSPDSASRAFLLEIAPGVRIPQHGHEGREMTCVLRGSFVDRGQRHTECSFSRADEEDKHDIFVDSQTPCVCLVAFEGRTRPTHWTGRLYQRLRDL
jgi:putative transcriptional regulator